MNDSFLFYRSWLEQIDKYIQDDNEKNNLIASIVRYGIEDKKILTGTIIDMFLSQTYAQIDSAKAKHAARVEAGRKGGQKSKGGGAPVGNKNANKNNKQTTSKQQPNDNVNVNDNDNVNVNDNITTSAIVSPLTEDDSDDWFDSLIDEREIKDV